MKKPHPSGDDAAWLAYVRTVWAIQQGMQCYGGASIGGFFGGSDLIESGMLALVLVTAVTGSRNGYRVATVGRLCLRMMAVPWIWEAEVWTSVTDLVMLYHGCDVEAAAPTIRVSMIACYAAAAFWKINSSFMDHTVSCGSIFFAQLTDLFMPSSVAAGKLTNAIVSAAPAMALVVEVAVPVLLLFDPSYTGLLLALIFHVLVVFTPPPNNAGGFSVSAGRWLFFFSRRNGIPEALREMFTALSKTGTMLWTLTAALLSLAFRQGSHPFFFDTAVPCFCAQFVLLGYSCISARKSDDKLLGSGRGATISKMIVASLVVVYAFVLPTIGFDQMAPNMFSNQRFHGSTNHLLNVPTGLLHRHDKALYSVVRVESSTSPAFARYPSEVTASFTPRVREILVAAGHSGRMWNPMLGRVVGLKAIAGKVQGSEDAAYTVPAVEFRRLMAEAMSLEASFSVSFAVLDGLSGGDETWRRESGTVVVFEHDEEKGNSCSVPESFGCKLAELLPPPWYHLKFVAYQPLPIVKSANWSQIHCYGP